MLTNLKAIAKRSREQAGSSRRADQCKRLDPQVERTGMSSFTVNNVDTKVLHRRIEILFNSFGKPMNLVDEQHRAFVGIGQIGHQVLRSL